MKIFLLSILIASPLFAQQYNTIVKDEKTGKPMLIGFTTREAFNDTSFSWWWNSAYNMYEVDSVAAAVLKEKLKDIDITVVMGSWCSDSRREVPHFYKLLDEIGYPADKITLINVDREKHGKGDEADSLNINFVPTFIFYKEGKELGRIIEMPYETLEKDIQEIITGKNEEQNN